MTIIGTNLYMDSAIEDSYNEIQDELSYGIFENNKSFGTRDKTYTIVSYKLSKIPKIDVLQDVSSYNQQYGGIDKFYSSDGGWNIYVYEKDEDFIYVRRIEPYAVGISSKAFIKYSPEELFNQMYNNIIKDNDYNIGLNNDNKITKIRYLKTTFHKIDYTRDEFTFSDIVWYDSGGNKMYCKISNIATYRVICDYSKINIYYFIIPIIIIILITILLFLLFKYLKNRKKRVKSKSNYSFGITLKKSSEDIIDNLDDNELLLERINPSNFMSPYDPVKVKIANDLYSALLNAKGNETIISMIKEKAKNDLGVDLP